MPSAQQWRATSLCTFVLFCWMIMNRPFLVEGEFSCYKGSVDIVNGELRVASTKSIVLQQCSLPTTQQPPSPTGINGTEQPAISQSSNLPTPQNTTSADNVTTPSSNNTNSTGNSTSPFSSTTPGNETTPDNTTTPLPTTQGTASANPEAPPGNSNATGTTNLTTATPPPVTDTSAPTTPGPSSAATSTPPAGGCVVTKTNQSDSRDNMTVSFSCPVPDSPCKAIGFNGSTGAENQTQCCVGGECNTIDSFIMRENLSYSKVDSCFVGTTTDANETLCGDSSNMCLTITDTMKGDNATAYYCGNEMLQSYCEQDGALREGSFKQESTNVRCCGSTNCNTPTPPSTPAPSSMTPNSSAITDSSTAVMSSSTATPLYTATPPPTATPPHSATPPPTATRPSTGAPKTSAAPAETAKHSNKILIGGVVGAFVVGILGGIIVTVIICRRRSSSVARPGELLAFDNFHYKRMGADEVNEEVFMS